MIPKWARWPLVLAFLGVGLHVFADLHGRRTRVRFHRKWELQGVSLDPASLQTRFDRPGALVLAESKWFDEASPLWDWPPGRVLPSPDLDAPGGRKRWGPSVGATRPLIPYLDPPPATDEEAARLILAGLSGFDADLAELSVALETPGAQACRFDLSSGARQIPADFHDVTSLLELRAAARIRLGDETGALREIRTSLALQRTLGPSPQGWIPAIWQAAATAKTTRTIWEGLDRGLWTEPSLSLLAEDLSRISFLDAIADLAWLEAARFDRSLQYPALRSYLCGGFGASGFEAPDWEDPSSWGEWARANVRHGVARILPEGCLHAACVRSQADLIETLVLPGWRGLPSVGIEHLPAFWDSPPPESRRSWWERFLGTDIFDSPNGRFLESLGDSQQQVDLAVLAVALERHRLRHGTYPPSLEALVPALLPAIPVDRFAPSRTPVYLPRSGGRFRLHASGPDRSDDGGTPRIGGGSGDIVWSYPEP